MKLSPFEKLVLGIFTLWVWVAGFTIMTIVAILTFALLPLFPYRKTHSYIAAPGFTMVLRSTFSRITIEYDKDFNPDRRSVFCQNHTNLFDAHLASAAIPHPFCGLMDAWQFKIPIYGWMMKVSKGIPVHRGKKRNNLPEITEAAKDRIAQGFSILAFPEGHRTITGKLGKYRRGVIQMARDAGAPVVPIAVRGMFEVKRKTSFFIRPGNIHVLVGPQIETSHLSNEELKEVVAKLRQFTANFVEEKSEEVIQNREALAS